MPTQPTGQTIDVARVLSTGQDRKTGDAIIRVKDHDGRTFALRLRPARFKTLAKGVLGVAVARGEIDEIK
jgi:hypothetical protein